MSSKIDQLRKQIKRLQTNLEREQAKEAARLEVEKVVATFGHSLQSLFGEIYSSNKNGHGRKRGRALSRYRSPDNHRLTWSGPEHRPKPTWVKEFQDTGGDIETLRIAGR